MCVNVCTLLIIYKEVDYNLVNQYKYWEILASAYVNIRQDHLFLDLTGRFKKLVTSVDDH